MPKDFDLLKNKFVPEHIILSEEEKRQVLDKYNISEDQLPKILLKDPVVKKLDAKKGDLIKIIRNSPTAGQTVYYRLVVK